MIIIKLNLIIHVHIHIIIIGHELIIYEIIIKIIHHHIIVHIVHVVHVVHVVHIVHEIEVLIKNLNF